MERCPNYYFDAVTRPRWQSTMRQFAPSFKVNGMTIIVMLVAGYIFHDWLGEGRGERAASQAWIFGPESILLHRITF